MPQPRARRKASHDAKATRPQVAPPARSRSDFPRASMDPERTPSLRPLTASTILTPPVTPAKDDDDDDETSSDEESTANDTLFDFSQIDYELDRARRIGQGLWSSVYFAEPVLKSPRQIRSDDLTPPSTPPKNLSLPFCRLFAVKAAARPDAHDIFQNEAKILTRLQRSPRAHQHLVPFYGLDPRNTSLVFEGVIGGSLEDLESRLKVMTELARHLEIRSLFPGLAKDLISGLHFIHDAGVVHADIKPGNILIDIVEDAVPVLRARYIDFSASFVQEEGSTANAGGTWDFMAPEQLRIQKDLNRPSFASDVWSLGITLLSVMVGGSPYAAACGGNLFMLREAIKSGDALGFVQMDPVVHKRLAACQDFIDCCRLALQKDRERRCTSAVWELWVAQQNWGG